MDTRVSAAEGPLKILFLTDSPITVSGGSERFLRNLANGLAREHFLISVVQLCDEPRQSERLHEASISAKIDLRHVPCGAVYARSGLHAYRVLRSRVLDEGFHVIQSQHENADVLNALLPRGPLRAIRISNRRDTGFLKSARLRFASRLLNHRFDRIVAPAAAILDSVVNTEHARRDHMLCIPNGVDAERFRPGDGATLQHVRADFGLPDDALLVGCVADLFAVKRHIDLIEGFAHVREKFPSAHLLVVGDGPLHGAVEARVQDCHVADAVHLLGSRKDVDALLPALDVFALASDTEGLSNAILEAQACGLPVVATDVGGNPALVDAECGRLVAPRDPDALAEAICELLHDPDLRTRMGTAARARVVRDHSLDAMTRAYANLYRERTHAR